MTHGIRGFIPRRRDWQKQLDGLRTWDGQPLPARLTAEIARECERLHLIIKQIAGAEAEQRAAVEQPALAGTAPGRIQNLFKLRGIGLTSASSLEHEVFFRAFGNRRQLGGYIGLGSSPWQSGSVARDQGIAKSGNRAREPWRSSWPGCGCAISPKAPFRAGSTPRRAKPRGVCAGLLSWPWRAS